MTLSEPDDLTDLERRWHALMPPEESDAARAIYQRTRLWTSGNLPAVDVPYDARREDHWAAAARVADYAGALPAARAVLDIGPGDGWPAIPLAQALPLAQVTGIDPASRRTEVCRANASRLGVANASFVTASADALPFLDGTADLVTAAASLEETPHPERTFEEISRVLRPGGVLRASYQVWRLPAPEVETVALTEGVDGLLYVYARRSQVPARERRYLLLLPSVGVAAEAHREALIASAAEPRAYGETLLRAGSPIGEPLLERLASMASASLVVELRRWTTPWLMGALQSAGFRDVRATQHPGDLARMVARRLIASGGIDAAAMEFDVLTRVLGEAAASLPGEEMVTAVR
ncbi:MAG: class I SAM-dependent methyltransferase [Chloroflexi bacterium]|nr:class I SAM-dependent methyltransferase [Chloroflexota bacterium]